MAGQLSTGQLANVVKGIPGQYPMYLQVTGGWRWSRLTRFGVLGRALRFAGLGRRCPGPPALPLAQAACSPFPRRLSEPSGRSAWAAQAPALPRCSSCPLPPPGADLKPLGKKPEGPGPKRFRIWCNDGHNVVSCMLATQLADLADQGVLSRGCIISVTEMVANEVQGRK